MTVDEVKMDNMTSILACQYQADIKAPHFSYYLHHNNKTPSNSISSNDPRQQSTNMPFPPAPLDKFSSSDCRNIALFSIPPLSAALIGTLALRNENLVKNRYVPAHVPRNFRFYLMMNCLTTAPLGCAAYLVWKNGGLENTDNRFANILNGATLLSGLTMAPAYKLGGFKLLAANTGLLAVLALATTAVIDRIEKGAGTLVFPFAAWAAYCVVNSILILCYSKPHVAPGPKCDWGGVGQIPPAGRSGILPCLGWGPEAAWMPD